MSFLEKSMEQERNVSMINDLKVMMQLGKENNITLGSEDDSELVLGSD